MTFSFANLADALKSGAPISPEDVLAARRWAWSDGGIRPEAETIFGSTSSSRPLARVERLLRRGAERYVVNGREQRLRRRKGRLAGNAGDRDGRVDTLTELEPLVKVLETALNVPESLMTMRFASSSRLWRSAKARPGVADRSARA